MRSLTAAPDAHHFDHLSLSAQLWTTLMCPSPTLRLKAGGKQQLGSVMKAWWLMQRNQRACLKTHQRQPRRQNSKGREGTGSKGPTEGFLCSASVSRAWQATWKQFSFFPQTYRIKSMLVIDIKGSPKKKRERQGRKTPASIEVWVCGGAGGLWYLRIKSDCMSESSEDPENMGNWEKVSAKCCLYPKHVHTHSQIRGTSLGDRGGHGHPDTIALFTCVGFLPLDVLFFTLNALVRLCICQGKGQPFEEWTANR